MNSYVNSYYTVNRQWNALENIYQAIVNIYEHQLLFHNGHPNNVDTELHSVY